MITHAKVRYEDNRKLAVVDIRDIENFHPENAKDFKSKFFYSVKWTDPDGTSDFYRARILALGESEEDLEAEGRGRQRLRFERMAYSPDGEDEDDDVEPEVLVYVVLRRLQRQGIPETLMPAALKQLNHFVVEKLADLERLAKR
ncbi:hypothetical protein HPB52_022140 [Rhipicephalus sanguineus]|uniref:Uncharacterized protein n=1 Tax=Rhipicephalus sanguineus TaxID=34632 RepID=A0A9D4TBS5_RHISA|nr:hypothetical protein HPB52_022140 [Rhipicephalus sanguineus]